MADRVLVAYATRYGSTQEVAEEIGRRLRERGIDADVGSAHDVRSLDGYSAVVLGTAMYIGAILKDSATFLEGNQAALEKLPVAIFALGPLSHTDDMDEARQALATALGKHPWFSPVAAEVFIGAYDPSHLRLADKLIAALPASPLHGVGPKDERDWTTIHAWADKLPGLLRIPAGVG